MRKRMRKRIFSKIAVFILSAAVLTGCGAGNTAGDRLQDTASGSAVTGAAGTAGSSALAGEVEIAGLEDAHFVTVPEAKNGSVILKETKIELEGFSVEIPQFTGMGDAGKQKRLNEMIQKKVRKQIRGSGIKPDREKDWISMDSSVTCLDSTRAGMLFIFEGYSEGGAHPGRWIETVNLDLANESYLTRSDLVFDKQKLQQLLLAGKGKKVFDLGFLKEKRKKKNRDVITYWSDVKCYLTKDGIGVVISLSYAMGSYAIYEVSAEDYSNQKRNPYFPWTGEKYEYEKINGGTFQAEFNAGEKIQKEVTVSYDNLTSGESTCHIEINTADEEIPVELLDLGIFGIETDRIIRLAESEVDMSPEQLEKWKPKGKMPEQSVEICSEKEVADVNEGKAGKHFYNKVIGDEVIFYSYDNSVKNGKYQLYVWKKEAGLVAYRCGTGGQGDSVRIWKPDILINTEVLQEDFYVPGSNAEKAVPVVKNPYFPYVDGDKIPCVFWEPGVGDFQGAENFGGNLNWHVRNVENSQKGSLYILAYNYKDVGKYSELLEKSGGKDYLLDVQRGCHSGYYWVTADKIYWLSSVSPEQQKILLQTGKVPVHGVVVCQEQDKPDRHKPDKVLTDHTVIQHYKGNICCYRSCWLNGSGDVRDIQLFIWKKNVGLIGYAQSENSLPIIVRQKGHPEVTDIDFANEWPAELEERLNEE